MTPFARPVKGRLPATVIVGTTTREPIETGVPVTTPATGAVRVRISPSCTKLSIDAPLPHGAVETDPADERRFSAGARARRDRDDRADRGRVVDASESVDRGRERGRGRVVARD